MAAVEQAPQMMQQQMPMMQQPVSVFGNNIGLDAPQIDMRPQGMLGQQPQMISLNLPVMNMNVNLPAVGGLMGAPLDPNSVPQFEGLGMMPVHLGAPTPLAVHPPSIDISQLAQIPATAYYPGTEGTMATDQQFADYTAAAQQDVEVKADAEPLEKEEPEAHETKTRDAKVTKKQKKSEGFCMGCL